MKSSKNFLLVLVTAPNLKTARDLAKAALEARLIACANLVPRIESNYWWEGKIQSASEVLMLLKTTAPRFSKLEALILSKHPYRIPEVLSVPLSSGTRRYLAWIVESLRTDTGSRH